MASRRRIVLTTLLTTFLSLLVAPAASADEQICENGLVGAGLPTDASAETPTGTSADVEVVRCWTYYDDPFYLHFHRSVNATVEDDATGLAARAHVSEYAGGVHNEENGTDWSYYGYVVAADVGDRDGDLPQADLLVHHYGSSVNGEGPTRWHVRGGIVYADEGHAVDEDFDDPYLSAYETYVEPLLP